MPQDQESSLRPEPPRFPPQEQRIGNTVVAWWWGRPGEAVIMAHGGSVDDRALAEQVVKWQLAPFGVRRASFTFDHNHRTAAWDDIMAKAKRLVQSGNVTVLRNGYHNVVGHVVGDHGEYNTEIGRDDPFSRAITTWQCECPWDQYAWQRTRQWKKYEGRPCSHVMALYWQALGTPLDEQGMGEDDQGAPGPGQKMPDQGAPAPAAGPEIPPSPFMNVPELGKPDASLMQGPGGPAPSGPPQAPLAPPMPPQALPPSPMEQLQMQQPPIPGGTPAGMPAPPNSVSVPGARLPSPFNPIQYPGGTYSHEPSKPPHYRVQKDPGVEKCRTCTMFDKGKCWGYGNHAVEPEGICDSYYRDNRKTAADYTNGQRVRAKNALYGVAEGRDGATDAGQYMEVPQGKAGEVIDQDETTGWVECIFPLEGGPMTSYHVRCFVEPGDIYADQQETGTPFIRRRN